jgi:hypothetical protein
MARFLERPDQLIGFLQFLIQCPQFFTVVNRSPFILYLGPKPLDTLLNRVNLTVALLQEHIAFFCALIILVVVDGLMGHIHGGVIVVFMGMGQHRGGKGQSGSQHYGKFLHVWWSPVVGNFLVCLEKSMWRAKIVTSLYYSDCVHAVLL